MANSVTVIGLPNVLRMFEKAQIETEIASHVAPLAAAEALAVEMRAKAPVDTGALRASIKVTPTEEGAEVGATVPYARFVEFGTRYMAAEPFESEASGGAAGKVVAIIAAVFKRLL